MAAEKPIPEIPSLTQAKYELLRDAGFSTVQRIAMAKVAQLEAIKGIGEETALKFIGEAQEATGIGAPRTSNLVYHEWMEETRILSTGSKSLDALLGGGFRASFIYEIAGRFGSSKSQLVCQILANVITPKVAGGWGGTAMFIDTEGTSGPLSGRIRDFVKGNGIPEEDLDEVMSNLEIVKSPNSESQTYTVRMLLERNHRFDVLAIDGMMTKFRAEFIGRAHLADRQGLINDHLDDLKVFSSLNKSLVVYTNQVSDTPELYGGTHAIGGNVLGHAPAFRLMVRKGKGQQRIIRLDKAPNLPEGEAVFELTSEGITDA